MNDLLYASTYFFTALTVVTFALADVFQKKTQMVIFNPIIVSALGIIAVLKMLDIPSEVYQEECRVLTYLLTPATICLAISFYVQISKLKKQRNRHHRKVPKEPFCHQPVREFRVPVRQ